MAKLGALGPAAKIFAAANERTSDIHWPSSRKSRLTNGFLPLYLHSQLYVILLGVLARKKDECK
jgi:hypothetical protein